MNENIEKKTNNDLSPSKATFILLEDTYSGKTTFINRYIEGKLNDYITKSAASNYVQKTILFTNINFILEIIDNAAISRKVKKMFTLFFNRCNGYIILYDVTVKQSYEEFEFIIKEDVIPYLQEKRYTHNIPLYLIANKIDKFGFRVITKEQEEELANRYGFKYFEVSVYNDIRVNEVMSSIIIDYFMNLFIETNECEIINDKNENMLNQIRVEN